MATEFRKKKCHHFFYTFMDQNKDGSIDKEDMEVIIKKIIQIKGWKSDGPEIGDLRDRLYKILDGMLEEMDTNHDGKVSFEEYVVLFDKYAKNPTKPPEWQNLYVETAYNCLRSSKTGVVAQEDYVNLMTVFGFEIKNAAAAFKEVSKGKDSINREEYNILWKEYFLSDDPKAPGNLLCGIVVI